MAEPNLLSKKFPSLPAHFSPKPDTCGICENNLVKPRYLPACDHSFCHQCLVDDCCGSEDPETIICAVCRQPSAKPKDGIAAFPTRRSKRPISEHQSLRTSRKKKFCEVHTKDENPKNYYCHTCGKLICRDCQTFICKDHKIQYLTDAAKQHRAILDEKEALLKSKRKEFQDAIGEVSQFRRLCARVAEAKVNEITRGKDRNVSKFDDAAKIHEKHKIKITEQLSNETSELFKKSLQIQQAMEKLSEVKESDDDHFVSGQFTSLVKDIEELNQIQPKKLSEEEKTALDVGNVVDVPLPDDGVYKYPGVDTLRLILIGLTGAGKSSTGNNILAPAYLHKDTPKYGEKIKRPFKTSSRGGSVTEKCESRKAQVRGRIVTVVDTPGFYDTERKYESTIHEILNCMYLSAPGPHVILLVIRLGRETDEVVEGVKKIRRMFGKDFIKYLMIVFTGADQLENDGENISDVVENMKDGPIQDLLHQCEFRYVPFNNSLSPLSETNVEQIDCLLKMAEDITGRNDGHYFTEDVFTRAGDIVEKTLEEHEKEIKTLTGTKTDLKDKLNEARRKLEKAQTKDAESRQQVANLESELEEKNRRIQELQVAIEHPQTAAMEKATEEVQRVKEELKEKALAAEKAEIKATQLAERLHAAEEDASGKQQKIDNLEETLVAKDAAIQELQERHQQERNVENEKVPDDVDAAAVDEANNGDNNDKKEKGGKKTRFCFVL